MSDVQVACPSCGAVHTFTNHVPFRDECETCAADLHVCVACKFYDRYASDECREVSAEPVATKDRSNLCEFFKPKAIAGDDVDDKPKDPLAALFGKGDGDDKPDDGDPLAALFGKKD